MKILLRLKHWELFIVIFIIPMLIMGVNQLLISNIRNQVLIKSISAISQLLVMGLLYSWFWTIGTLLFTKIPKDTKLKILWFKLSLLTFFIFIQINSFFYYLFVKYAESIIGIIWMFTMFTIVFTCYLYCIWFILRLLKSIEKGKDTRINILYESDFKLLFVFPIGLWIIQPRINKIFDNN